MVACVVVRGTVDTVDAASIGEQRRLNLLAPGHSARNGRHIRRYWPGDIIPADEIGAGELARLVTLGICKWATW
jgi:hypothetical protein